MRTYKTKNKEIIYMILLKNIGKSLSVKDITKILEKKKIKIGISSIYRILNKLENENKLHIIIRANGEKTYELLLEDCKDHLHVKCKVCGNIYHIKCDKLFNILKHIEDDHGIKIDSLKSIISGKCKKCEDNE